MTQQGFFGKRFFGKELAYVALSIYVCVFFPLGNVVARAQESTETTQRSSSERTIPTREPDSARSPAPKDVKPVANSEVTVNDLIGRPETSETSTEISDETTTDGSLQTKSLSMSATSAAGGDSGISPESAVIKFMHDAQGGAGVINLPIVMPAGRGGLQPSVSLVYSPRAGNGPFGFGWAMGFAAIERSTKWGYPKYDGTDNFICTLISPEIELVKLDETHYRARREGAYMKFYFHDGIWEVKDKKGNTYYFGLDTLLEDNSREREGDRIFRWRLSEVKDVHGNYYFIRHFSDGSFEVRFTGEPGTDRDLLNGGTQNFFGIARAEVESAPREDDLLSYREGFAVNQDKRIKSISVYADGNLMTRYAFEYAYSRMTNRSLLSVVRQFGADGVTEKKPITLTYDDLPTITYDLNAINDNPLEGDKLWNARFDGGYDRGHNNSGPKPPGAFDVSWGPKYTQASGSWARGSWSIDSAGRLYVQSDKDSANWFWTYLYVTADMSIPVPFSGGGEVGIWINGNYSTNYRGQSWPLKKGYNLVEVTAYHQHAGFSFSLDFPIANHVALMNSTQVVQPQYAGDFNADGLMDVATYYNKPEEDRSISVALSTGSAFLPKTQWNAGFGYGTRLLIGDLEGEGSVDLVSFDPATGDWLAALSKRGQQKFLTHYIWLYGFGAGENPSLADFNGDGMSDPWAYTSDPTNGVRARFGINSGGGFKVKTGLLSTGAEHGSMAWGADFNGDGLSDLGFFNQNTGNWRIKLNLGRNDFTFGNDLTLNGFGQGFNPVVTDFNGDGMTDIGYYDYNQGKLKYREYHIAFFSDVKELTINFTLSGSNVYVQTSDFNGDGLQDFAAYDDFGHVEIAYSSGRFADILLETNNGQGGRMVMEYSPSSNYQNIYLPFVIPVVRTVQLHNAQGQTFTTRYSYAQGYWFISVERKFMGFYEVKAIDPEENYTISHYQVFDYYGHGNLADQASYDRDGNLYSKIANNWGFRILDGNTANYPYNYALIPLEGRETWTYDGDGSGHRTKELFFYDEEKYFDLVKTVQLGEVDLETGEDIGEDSRTAETTYVHNSNENTWLLGFPKEVIVKDHAGQIVRQSQFFYDNHETLDVPPVLGHLTKKIDLDPVFDDPVALYAYDSYGNLLETTDPRGYKTHIVYDTQFHMFPVSTSNALGHAAVNEYYGVEGVPLNGDGYYGIFGQLKSSTDPNGQTAGRVYDIFGRPVKSIGPGDSLAYPTGSIGYLETGEGTIVTRHQRIRHGEPAVMAATEFYDGLGRMIQAKKASGVEGKYIVAGHTEYNSRGLPEKKYVPRFTTLGLDQVDSIDPASLHTLIEYDAMGRVVKTTSPDGTYSNVAYDDWTLTAWDENGHMQKSYSDSYGRLVRREEYTGADGRCAYYPAEDYALYATTLYSYDSEGNLVETRDAHGNTTTIAYNNLGQKISMDDPDMGHWEYRYDVNGNLAWQTDAKNQRIDFTYDALNRLVNKTDGAQLNVTYIYDDPAVEYSKGKLTRVEYASSPGALEYTEFYYDALGREIRSVKTVDGISYEVQRRYNALNNLLEVQYPDGQSVFYDYNAVGQMKSVSEIDPALGPLSRSTGVDRDPVLVSRYSSLESRVPRDARRSFIGHTIKLVRSFYTGFLEPYVLGIKPAYADEGLVGHWKFDEPAGALTAVDSSGAGNSGTVVGAATGVEGKDGYGYYFDGNSSYVKVNNSASLNMTTAVTVSAWIYPTDWTGNCRILQKGVTDKQYRFLVEWSKLKFDLYGVGYIYTGSLPSLNTWHHVVGTYDGAVMRLYVDGIQVASKIVTASLRTTADPLCIGTKTVGAPEQDYFKGIMDEVKIWNRGLSAAEVFNLYMQPADASGTGRAFRQDPDTDGIVSIDTEHYHNKVDQSGKSWTAVAPADCTGESALQALPNTGVLNDTGYVTKSPRMDYKVNFNRAGTHYIWARGIGVNGNDDSYHFGIDGQAVTTSDRISSFNPSWTWSHTTQDGPVASFDVTAPGEHTVNVWMREDGFIIDKIVVTSDPNYVPSGYGPAESPQGEVSQELTAPVLNAPTLSTGQVNLSWSAVSAADGFLLRYGNAPRNYNHDVDVGNVSQYVVTGLPDGDTYYFAVAAYDADGSSYYDYYGSYGVFPETSPVSNEQPVTIPAMSPPVLNDAVADGQNVTLSWSPEGEPLSFKVKYGTVSGEYPNVIDVSGESTSVIEGLTFGQTYYFVVTSVYVYGESANSNEVSADVVLVPELVGHLTFNDEHINDGYMVDQSGHNNDGLVLNDSRTFVSAAVDEGMSFDEINDRTVIEDFSYGDSFTVSFWFKTDDLAGSSYQYIFSHGTAGQKNSLSIYLGEKSSSLADKLRTNFMDGNDSATYLDVSVPQDNRWHLYTLRVSKDDPVRTRVYIDGVQKASKSTIGGDAFDPTMDIFLGSRYDLNVDRFYGGGLDDVRIYNYPLSQAEIDALVAMDNQVLAPAAPVLNAPEPGDGLVSLTWNAVDGADGYRVYWGTAPGVFGAPVDAAAQTEFTVQGLSNGTAYYFSVKAYNAGGDSVYSNEVSAVPAAPVPLVYIQNIVYNVMGQPERVEYGNGAAVTFTYDPLNFRLTRKFSVNAGGLVLQDLNYEYDAVGNIVAITDNANSANQSFQYDELNRLVEADGETYGTKTYAYDEIGNLREKDGKTYTYGEFGAACPEPCRRGVHAVSSLSDGTTFQYDLNGNMIAKLSGAETKEFIYDVENRLIEVKINGDTVAKFEYDGDGGRTAKDVWTGPSHETRATSNYVGSLFEITDGTESRHVYLGSQRLASITNGRLSYVFDDHLGGANVITDAAGSPKELIEYKPFGGFARRDQFVSGEATIPMYFTGQRYDDETGLYYYGARYYDPELGRFIQPDTIVQNPYDPQTLNRYSYCGNNPVNRLDPTGHKWSWGKFWKSFAGAVIGAAVTVLTGGLGAPIAFALGGMVGGAVTGGLEGGWRGALMGGLMGGVLGGGVGFGVSTWGAGFGYAALVAGGGYAIGTGHADSFVGGLAGGIVGAAIGNGIQSYHNDGISLKMSNGQTDPYSNEGWDALGIGTTDAKAVAFANESGSAVFYTKSRGYLSDFVRAGMQKVFGNSLASRQFKGYLRGANGFNVAGHSEGTLTMAGAMKALSADGVKLPETKFSFNGPVIMESTANNLVNNLGAKLAPNGYDLNIGDPIGVFTTFNPVKASLYGVLGVPTLATFHSTKYYPNMN